MSPSKKRRLERRRADRAAAARRDLRMSRMEDIKRGKSSPGHELGFDANRMYSIRSCAKTPTFGRSGLATPYPRTAVHGIIRVDS